MFGLVGKITAVSGKRDVLGALLKGATGGMPGNLAYVVAACAEDADVLWVTEVWENEAAHQASLQLPAVQAAIAEGRPMIAGMSRVATTQPY